MRIINIKTFKYLFSFGRKVHKMEPQTANKDMQGATIIKQQNTELIVQGKAKYIQNISKLIRMESLWKMESFTILYKYSIEILLYLSCRHIQISCDNRKQKFGGVSIIDALSASGLRTIRFLKQLDGVKVVYANDISPASHKLMRDNFDLNDLDQRRLKMTMQDANLLLQNQKKNITFDIIDLDPYGSVVPFLDSSVESIKDGGLMCVTCTDTKVTCGPDIQKCYYYYGTTRAKVQHFNENALRIVLSTISSAASRHCKYIEPLVSFQAGFYLRVFLVVRRGKKECAESGTKIGNVFNCNTCGNYSYHSFFKSKQKKQGHFVPNKIPVISSHCQNCNDRYHLNGPIWLANINNLEFVDKAKKLMQNKNSNLQLKTHKKIYGTLHSILQEKELGHIPLGFCFDLMCKNIKAATPNRKMLFAGLQSLGFNVEPSYISPGLYKTNAPIIAVYDLIKSWKKKTAQDKYLSNVTSQNALNILNRQIQFNPDFEHKPSQRQKLPHFISMGQNMGPKGKPQSRVLNESEIQQFLHKQDKKDQPNKQQ